MSRSKNLVIPNSENEFLSDILASIKKRSKSLKYNSWELSVERLYEESKSGRVEKLEIMLKPSNYNAWLEVGVWEDRWITVNCWERTKENKWDWFYEGKFTPKTESKAFINAIESTNVAFFEMTSPDVNAFSSIWSPILADGLNCVEVY